MRNPSPFWNETFQLPMEALRANKVRGVLTMVGVIVLSCSTRLLLGYLPAHRAAKLHPDGISAL